MMALHDDWLTPTQKAEIARLWRMNWQRGPIPSSCWGMLIKLNNAKVDISTCNVDWYIPNGKEKMPEWQIAMCRKDFDPDIREQLYRERVGNLPPSETKYKRAGAEKAADSKRKKNQIIIDTYIREFVGPIHRMPRSKTVATWWCITQGLPISEINKLARRLEGTGLVR